MGRFKLPCHAQRFLATHDQINTIFRPLRNGQHCRDQGGSHDPQDQFANDNQSPFQVFAELAAWMCAVISTIYAIEDLHTSTLSIGTLRSTNGCLKQNA